MIEELMFFPTEALFGEVEAKCFYAPFDVLFKSPEVALPICRRLAGLVCDDDLGSLGLH